METSTAFSWYVRVKTLDCTDLADSIRRRLPKLDISSEPYSTFDSLSRVELQDLWSMCYKAKGSTGGREADSIASTPGFAPKGKR